MAFGSTLEEAKEKAALLQKSDGHQLEKNKIYNLLTKSLLWTNDDEYNQALTWAKYSAYTMVVEEFGKGIWAGLPWFKDNWGRDTFIALPGTLLVSGNFEEAKEVINNFATFQNLEEGEDYGRVPNRVTSLDNMIYNTTDGTPWLIREIYEYIQYSGDTEYGKEIFPVVKRAIEGAIENFVDDDGFMNHDAADTWMDARINNKEPWSDSYKKLCRRRWLYEP
ncbi:MAG: hypothetical protein B6229_09940 [Spirochaetaceae bacterium 4572_7]|nr:MAG: hypothetical protein B6229_09940 [Spirochaetaceae bacterium 4572_7]